MITKLFYENQYLKECKANVLEIIEDEKKCVVVLDKTIFYPEGGGQPCDLGTIDDIEVLNVYEKNDVVYHELSSRPVNKEVMCKIDYNRRVDHMQQHTGEHLLSCAFYKLYNAENCGFHMGKEYVNIDFNIKDVDEEIINKVELEVNNYIYGNYEIKTYFVNKEEKDKLPLRKKSDVDSNIRIVQIGDLDYSACCGTHTKYTGEVGIVKIVKTEKYKGMTRVYFKCGLRALKDFQNKNLIVSEMSKYFSINENDLIEKVHAQDKTIKDLNKQLKDFKTKIAQHQVEELKKTSKDNIIIKKYSDMDFDSVKLIAKYFNDEKNILILASYIDKQILFAHDGRFDIHCGKVFKENLKDFNGRGGGSNKSAQAAFDEIEELDKFIDLLYLLVTNL